MLFRSHPVRRPCQSPAHLVFVKDVENKRSKLGGISEWEELLVDFLEACGIQLPAGAVLDEAFVPGGGRPGERGSKRRQHHPPTCQRPRKAVNPVQGDSATWGGGRGTGLDTVQHGLIPPLPLASCVTWDG